MHVNDIEEISIFLVEEARKEVEGEEEAVQG